MPEVGLFPHETIFDHERGTLFIYPEQLGIANVALGGRPRHAVSGNLYITQYRILFEAIGLNRIRGATTILLDTITDAQEIPAFPVPRLHLKAGVDYELFLFQIEQPKRALTAALRQSSPERCAQGRDNLLHLLLPALRPDQPPRAAVRATLDGIIVTPESALHALSLHNLWVSLGNA